ncbi:MAG: LPS assembly lipoprotein LptE [Gemmataceae bacterium]
MTRRQWLTGSLAFLAGCQSTGDFKILGYSTAPPFDPDIKSVYVPVFKNFALQTTPYRGLEVDITRAVIREISSRTPMKIITDPERADTELLGTLLTIEKRLLNRNQQNHVREAELILTVQIVWRDLRNAKVLSNPNPPQKLRETPPAFDPSANPAMEPFRKENALPISIIASGRLLPEVGESNATAAKLAVDAMARQIVNMMEKPW